MSRLSDAVARLVTQTRTDSGVAVPTGVIPPARSSLAVTSPSEALTLDSVYRCVTVIQTAAKQLTIDAWRGDDRLEGTAMPSIITRPSADLTQMDLIAETVASLAARGNAYWLIARDRDGQATGARVLDPLSCTPVLEPNTGERTVQWRGRTWTADKLRHLRLLRVPGDAEGLGPIQACATTLAGARDMGRYASQWVSGSGVPTGVLSTTANITSAQADEAKSRWNDSNGPGQGVAVLGNGLSYSPLALKPSEVQFLESRAFDVLSVGRMFGVPAHMLLASIQGSSMTYQNVADASLDFIRWTVMSYLREIEDALTAILPRGTTARFNLDALLRADAATRMSTHATAIAAGIYDPAWARRIEGIDETPEATPTTTPA